MPLEEILLFVVLGSLALAASVSNYAKDDYSGLLAVVAILLNILLIIITIISDLVPTPNLLFDQSLSLTGLIPFIVLGGLASIASLIFLFKISIVSQVKGDRLILRDDPIALFHKNALSSECRHNASRRCNLYLNVRENSSQYILPIEDLDQFSQLMDKNSDLDESITCCRCENLKPKYTGIAHMHDLQGVDWNPICEDCTMKFLNEALEQEDNYVSEEIILSRTV